MPIYDYSCQACKHSFETLVRAGTTPVCPQCGSTALDKCVSPIAPAGKIEAIRMAHRRVAWVDFRYPAANFIDRYIGPLRQRHACQALEVARGGGAVHRWRLAFGPRLRRKRTRHGHQRPGCQ